MANVAQPPSPSYRVRSRVRPEDTCRMFENELLEKFSRINPITIFLVWVPVGAFVLGRSLIRHDVPLLQVAALFAGGTLTWTLAEYVLHRWVFHWTNETAWGKRVHFLLHGVHHDCPNDRDRLVMPLPTRACRWRSSSTRSSTFCSAPAPAIRSSPASCSATSSTTGRTTTCTTFSRRAPGASSFAGVTTSDPPLRRPRRRLFRRLVPVVGPRLSAPCASQEEVARVGRLGRRLASPPPEPPAGWRQDDRSRVARVTPAQGCLPWPSRQLLGPTAADPERGRRDRARRARRYLRRSTRSPQIEEAAKTKVDLGIVDRTGLSKEDRVFKFTPSRAGSRADGRVTPEEKGAMKLGERLRRPSGGPASPGRHCPPARSLSCSKATGHAVAMLWRRCGGSSVSQRLAGGGPCT